MEYLDSHQTGLASAQSQKTMKILCLGNNTSDSDHQARELAHREGYQYHGLVSDLESAWSESDISKDGVYHSTPVDCTYHRLLTLANKFDEIVILDQPRDSFDHPDTWMLLHRVKQDSKTPCRDTEKIISIDYWQSLLDQNSSFCILPWVELMIGDAADSIAVKLCCRSHIRIDNGRYVVNDWQTDQRFVPIRNSMLAGTKLPHCSHCYKQEQNGLTSDRYTESLEWANRLGLTSIHELKELHAPAYVEVRSSNRCNLMCRMCHPTSSHRIAKEYHQLGLELRPPIAPYVDVFADIDPTRLKKIYVSGGEPMLNNDFFRWLDRHSHVNTVKVECLINTNGTKLPLRLRKHLSRWPNMQFIFSIDAYAELNHYIRWPSNWNSIVENWHYLRRANHRVHVNTTVSIYNVHRLSALYQFIDSIYPDTLLHVNLVQSMKHLDFALFPDKKLAQQDIVTALECQCVQNNRLVRETLQFVHDTVSTRYNDDMLKQFFRFNDLLDSSRGSKLAAADSVLNSYRE